MKALSLLACAFTVTAIVSGCSANGTTNLVSGTGQTLVSGTIDREKKATALNDDMPIAPDAHIVVTLRTYRGADGAAPVFLQADGPFRGFPVAFEMAGDGARAFADRGELLVETKVYNHAGTSLAVGDFTNEQRVSVTSQGEEVTVLVSGLESCTAQGSGGFCVGGE
ncbi:MAG: hypothetical protein JNM74_11810 [Myxococcales bacterium]|jgi:hypothetical protein|nr:hypothetical protein [Myxococcales bacterium]